MVITAGWSAAWQHAAEAVARHLHTPLHYHAFDSEALAAEWQHLTALPAGRALLVRPDGFVAWRSGPAEGPDALEGVLTDILFPAA